MMLRSSSRLLVRAARRSAATPATRQVVASIASQQRAGFATIYDNKMPFEDVNRHRSDAEQRIAQVPIVDVEGDVAVCDGGGGALGHPLEYIQLDTVRHNEPQTCKYCDMEVSLCGHATLATAWVLYTENYVEDSQIIHFHSLLQIKGGRRWIEMDFPVSDYDVVTDSRITELLREGLSLSSDDIIGVFHTQINDILVHISAPKYATLKPSFDVLAAIECRGISVTAAADDTQAPGVDFQSRFFTPAGSMPEDPVTGSAHCALAKYWSQRLNKTSLYGHQTCPSRGGYVSVELPSDQSWMAGAARAAARSDSAATRAKHTMGKKTNKRKRDAGSVDKDAQQVAAELAEVNDILQDDERSQKVETWQIGKRLKKLMDEHPKMSKKQSIDALFLWGTALARLATQNEDATLAEAAVDKFQEMHTMSGGDDAAMGPVGYSLWASSLLIVATEQRSREILDQALEKFEQAVEVDGGTTFETRFQFARALKEGADLVKFLEKEASEATGEATKTDHREYYKRALALCTELEAIHKQVSETKSTEQKTGKAEEDGGSDKEEDDSDDEDEDFDEEEEEEDPDDDTVAPEDLAEVKLLQAILMGMLEEEAQNGDDPVAGFERTLGTFKQAMSLDPENPGILMELASYIATKCRARETLPALNAVGWRDVLQFLDAEFRRALALVSFEMSECHNICVRKDTQQEEEPEDEENTDAQVPHLLHALGKAYVAYLLSEAKRGAAAKPTLASLMKSKGKQKQTTPPSQVTASETVELLRAAHHFHDKLGCYPLACLFAGPGSLQNEEQCRVWLETAESYGVLDDELELADFESVHDRPWFQKFTMPVEAVAVDDEPEQQ
ncbi:hypothetical protein P43SY_008647 [Pythium insidiosum]|uniref:Zinc finger CHCC-type domain-containing protein n=1 Tax=Pythium insidiosum TaxID=114742 RepID=A0AAD5LFM5_PYTIN|nr:hypothetical protein P43SY_008647 [Pythium insidiosum]